MYAERTLEQGHLFIHVLPLHHSEIKLAPRERIELPLTVLETAALPLYYRGKNWYSVGVTIPSAWVESPLTSPEVQRSEVFYTSV